ncbi:hypothetical protein, partial [Sansalvadorimonas verongulae]|uniref:hypothetical protein n=1 Tax=Sansalvadorimonas verongulae TaxID=2172824 RepID=UPI0012BB5641
MNVLSEAVSLGSSYYDVEDGHTSKLPMCTGTEPIIPKSEAFQELRESTPALSGRKIDVLTNHRKIVDRVIQTQIPDLTVDETSRQTMAEALAFSGIDTFEQVE